MQPKLGFIIPTMKRTLELNRLLDSLYNQTQPPQLLIIVDGSQTPKADKIHYHNQVPVIYCHHYPPSLTAQRNHGIDALPENHGLDYLGYLDDDLILEPNALEAMQRFISQHNQPIGGLSFNIIDDNVKERKLDLWLKRWLGVYSTKLGQISKGGSITPQINLSKDLQTQWLCGGATVYNIKIFNKHRFDEWYHGYALWEDVDFSYRVSQQWPFYVVADAKVQHLRVGQSTAEGMRRLGDLEIVDRFYFVTKHRSVFHRSSALWAGIGTTLWNLQYALRSHSKADLARVHANLCALFRCWFSKVARKAF